MTETIDLQCWYLHPERVSSFGAPIRVDLPATLASPENEFLARLRLNGALRKAILSRLATSPIPSVVELLLTQRLEPGTLCSVYASFRSRGLTTRAMGRRALKVLPVLHCHVATGERAPAAVHVPIDPLRFTARSAFSHLRRRDSMLLVVGFVESISGGVITVLPGVVATVLEASPFSTPIEFVLAWSEVHVDSIDSLALVRSEPRPLASGLHELAQVPEREVKRAFAAILSEQNVPKDWGGEKSDLYSAHVVVQGARRSAAFLFKGPSRGGTMTVAHLGVNGDQILRLSTEPAELLVLQHCHEVSPAVRELIRVVANQIGRSRMYCVIDGYDTLRVLRAYSACGFLPTPGASGSSD